MTRVSRSISFAILFFYSATILAQTYKPAVFTDPDRQKKIEATFPVIDQIYKDYAEKKPFSRLGLWYCG